MEDFELRHIAAFLEEAPTSRNGEPKAFGQILHSSNSAPPALAGG